MDKIWKTGPTKAFKIIKPVVHYGFVPLILYIAMKQEPQLTYVPPVALSLSLCRHARWNFSSHVAVLMSNVHCSRVSVCVVVATGCGRSSSHSRRQPTPCSCSRRVNLDGREPLPVVIPHRR